MIGQPDEQQAPAGAPETPVAPADATGVPSPPDEGEEDGAQVLEDLDALAVRTRERDDYLALAQRTQADFENYRKRMSRDVATAESRGVGRAAQSLLGALDNLEIAVRNLQPSEDDGDAARALTLARDELLAGLARCGVEHYWPEGERFDPTFHEAVGQQPAAEGLASGTIVSVYQRGYRVNGTVLRPARVVVAA